MTTSSEEWASEPARAPWKVVFDRDEHPVVIDALARRVALFESETDAQFVVACVNGSAGSPKAQTVRFVAAGVWLGTCNYCQPSKLLLSNAAMSALASLQNHFKEEHGAKRSAPRAQQGPPGGPD